MSLRDKFLQANDIEKRIVDLSEIKGYEGVKVEVRTMTADERSKALTGSVTPSGEVNFAVMYPKYVINSTYDPETGKKLFNDEDVQALAKKSGAVLEKIAKVAMQLAGLAPESFDAAIKNSETTPSDDSTTN